MKRPFTIAFIRDLESQYLQELITYSRMVELLNEKAEEYSELQSDRIQELFTKPAQVLKPLEDLWRKENTPNQYVIPDTTKFYEWIVKKIMNA